ncbi:hypothetical protein [Legionella micdadei]|uniref:hypothetical protein n=1 Tax=Legionella micdadei TaxID=451 RepID=UPI0009EF748F|nr:hypothetical protein [Legionella micdadei]ARH00662.1 hypothetical protein B6V88_09670 [Legionella micdadei]
MQTNTRNLKESLCLTLLMSFSTYLLSFNLEKDRQELSRADGMGIIGFYLSFTLTLYLSGKTIYNSGSTAFTIWGERRRRIQLENYKENLVSIKNKVYDLELRFSNLSFEEKSALYADGLVDKDAVGTFFLKFQCPISHQLMVDPVVICVSTNEGEKYETYDGISIREFIYLNPSLSSSPLSRLPIVKSQGEIVLSPDSLKQEHKEYLLQLEEAITNLEAKNRLNFNG